MKTLPQSFRVQLLRCTFAFAVVAGIAAGIAALFALPATATAATNPAASNSTKTDCCVPPWVYIPPSTTTTTVPLADRTPENGWDHGWCEVCHSKRVSVTGRFVDGKGRPLRFWPISVIHLIDGGYVGDWPFFGPGSANPLIDGAAEIWAGYTDGDGRFRVTGVNADMSGSPRRNGNQMNIAMGGFDMDFRLVNRSDTDLGTLQNLNPDFEDANFNWPWRWAMPAPVRPVPTVPGAPAAPTVVAADETATVTVTDPTFDGNAYVTGHVVVTEPARPGHPTPDITPVPDGAYAVRIDGLRNGVPVQFYAVARNRVGLGAPSPKSVPVTPVCDTHREACPYTFGGPGDIAVPADFNGDGHADFAVFRPNTGTWYLDTNRDGTTDTTIQFGSPGDRAYAADYNGDGHADLIIFRGTTGTWYIDTNLDGTADTVVRYASPGDLPYIGDFNHDGHIDLGIFRPSEGNWYVDTNSDGYGDVVEHYASPGDIPAPADYDRNNTVDYAIFRPGNGCFYINDSHYHAGQSTMRDGLSLPNGYATTVIGFAGPGDVMAPADYNGTGTTQLAIFRPSTGTWWIRNTAWNTPRGNETTACR